MKTLKKITAGITLTLAAMTATGCQTIQSTVESTATEAASSATDALLDEGKAKIDSMLDKGKDALSEAVGGASSSDASFDGSSYTGMDAMEALNALDTYNGAKAAGYSGEREALFGSWMDFDKDGCDTRDETLIAAMPDAEVNAKCRVLSGTMVDPYTGKTISATTADEVSKNIQIDHIVALSNAWDSGAHAWASPDMRYQIANDPLNLAPTASKVNQDKSDDSFDEWQAPSDSGNCLIAAHQIAVKSKYDLAVTNAERAALSDAVSTCGITNLPVGAPAW